MAVIAKETIVSRNPELWPWNKGFQPNPHADEGVAIFWRFGLFGGPKCVRKTWFHGVDCFGVYAIEGKVSHDVRLKLDQLLFDCHAEGSYRAWWKHFMPQLLGRLDLADRHAPDIPVARYLADEHALGH